MNKCLSCGKPVKNKYCNVSCQNKHLQKGKKRTEEQLKKQKQTIKNRWKIFMVNCFKCNKEIQISEYNTNEPKKEKYYCSRSCANSHIRTEESKKKTSDSIKNLIKIGKAPGFIKNQMNYQPKEHKIYTKQCLLCNKEFDTTNIKQQFCSVLCARKNNMHIMSLKYQQKIKNNPDWWSQFQKNLYASGKQYVAGGTTKWYNYKDIKVQGTYELRTCFILDKWKEEGKIKGWEYTNDRIEYIGLDNEKHSYLLDFKVFENNSSFYYIETKGYKKDNDELKWKATIDKGYKLKIWFEQDIIKKEKELGGIV